MQARLYWAAKGVVTAPLMLGRWRLLRVALNERSWGPSMAGVLVLKKRQSKQSYKIIYGWALPPVCLPYVSTLCLPDVTYLTKSPRPSSSINASFNRSNAGGGKCIGTKLLWNLLPCWWNLWWFFSRHLMHKLYKVAFRLPSTSDAKDVRIIFCFLVINR